MTYRAPRPLRTFLHAAAALCLLAVAACAGPNELSTEMAEAIDDGANRIILERQALQEMTADAPARAFFTDAQQHFRNNGFELVSTDADALVFTTNAREIDGQMMMFDVHIQPAAGGSRLVAEAMYRPAPGADFATAAWTSGVAQDAFGSATNFLLGLPYTDLAFATE